MASSAALWRSWRSMRQLLLTRRASVAARLAPGASISSVGSSARFSTTTVVVESTPASPTASAPPAAPIAGAASSAGRGDTLALLEKSIAQQAPTHALAYFDRLDKPPEDPLVVQKLAVLVAKRGRRHEVPRAAQFLRSIFQHPEVADGDYTQLAAIYVTDACLRHRMLTLAMEIYEESRAANVVLDLPAYNALLEALVEADEVSKAVEILKSISEAKDVEPTQKSYFPMLLAFMERCQYQSVTDLIHYGRQRGVTFTLDTYDPLVELGEIQGEDEDNLDGLELFMDYVNVALEEDGFMSDLEDLELAFHEDDEDDDSDGFDDDLGGEDFDDDDEFE